MKRKFLDRPNWRRVLKKKFYLTYIDNEDFMGYLSVVHIEKVREPLIKNMLGRNHCLVNDGYMWVECLPSNRNYCMTTMFNENLEIVQWYFDIIKSSGLDERGIPYFDDLYLDVVALPPDDILLLDEDELEEALQCKDITKEDYDLAYKEAEQIISDIDVEKLIKVSNKYLRMVLQDK